MRQVTTSEMTTTKLRLANAMVSMTDAMFEMQLPFELVLDMQFVTTQDGNPLTGNQVFNIHEWSFETFEYNDISFSFMYGDSESREWKISCLWENVPAMLVAGNMIVANPFYQIQKEIVQKDDWKKLPEGEARSYEMFKQNSHNEKFFKNNTAPVVVEEDPELDPIV